MSSSPPWIGSPGSLEQGAEIEGEDVDHLHRGFVGADRAQRFEMRFARLRGEHHELSNACPLFPGLDKFVHDTVQRPTSQGRAPGKGARVGVHAELDRRSPHDAECGRQVVREALDDDRVAADRQVWPVLLGRA